MSLLIINFHRSETLLCCIDVPKVRVIHRSLLANTIRASDEESLGPRALLADTIKESKDDTTFLEEILDALDKKEPDKVTINKPDHRGIAPLHLSVEQKNIKVTKLLLDHGADIDILNSEKQTALHIVCERKDMKRAALLLARQAEFSGKGKGEKEARFSEPPAIENLFSTNMTEEDIKDLPQLVLAIAASPDKIDIYDKLYNPDNNLFLFDVVSQGNDRLLKTILMGNDRDRTNFLNKRNKKLDTLLHVAVENGFIECATLLLGADVKTELNGQNRTPAIEDFFKAETADQVTPELVKALVRKVRTRLFAPDDADRLLGLQKSTKGHLFELVEPLNWDEVCAWRQTGFIHVLENPSLAKALVEWNSADEDKKRAAELEVEKCIKRGGSTIDIERTMAEDNPRVTVCISPEEMAATAWNETHNKKCEYS